MDSNFVRVTVTLFFELNLILIGYHFITLLGVYSNVETAKNLYNLYPRSINIPCADRVNGNFHTYPLHLTCNRHPGDVELQDQIEMVQFLTLMKTLAVLKTTCCAKINNVQFGGLKLIKVVILGPVQSKK